MIIEVPKVSPEGSIYSGDEPADCLELGGEQRVRVDGPIHYEFFAQVVSGELIVRGTLSAAFSLQCSRCATATIWHESANGPRTAPQRG